MKMKLLLLLGLIVGSLGVSAFFSGNAFAAGEVYRWENDNTIIGSGGNYNNKIQRSSNTGTTTRAVPVETVTFTRVGTSAVYKAPTNIFYTVQTGPTSGGSRTCNLQLAITVSSTNVTTGNLKVNDTGVEQCTDSGLSTTTSITGTGPDPASFAGGGEAADGASEEVVNTCDVDGVGWIICPVMNFIGMITDHAYTAVQALLTTQPLTFNAELNPTRDAWTIMRNFANIVFVIFFLFVIFSQLTSFGISNYGIKKILPRLIVVAILVNASYIICALAVDLSNILGVSLKGLFDNISQNYNVSLDNQDAQGIFNGQNMFANIIGAVLATGGALAITTMAGLSILLPIMITALVAIVTVVAVLTLRQALLIILIVISPLAFVAFLLPNTEDWFKKWRKLFTTLLLMYPIIAVIFGASAFAGTIIMNSADGPNRVLIQIMGAGVTIIPLFITPIVMKTAGTFLNRFGGGINNPNKGPFDRMRKGAQGVRERSKVDRGLRAMDPNKFSMPGRRKAINFTNKRKAIAAGRSEQFQDMQKEQIAKLATDPNSGFANKVAGDAPGKAELYSAKQASYLSSIDPDKLKLEVDTAQVKNAVGSLKLEVTDPSQNIPHMQKALIEAANEGDTIKARAAQEVLMNSGSAGVKGLREALQTIDPETETGVELRKDLASSSIKGSAADIHKWSIDKSHRSLDQIANDGETWSGLSSAQIAGQNEKSLTAAIGSGGVSAQMAKDAIESESAQNIGGAEKVLLMNKASVLIQNNTPTLNQPQTVQIQQSPGTLNVPHPPTGTTPANSRTSMPPNTGSMNQQRSSGLWVEPKDRQ